MTTANTFELGEVGQFQPHAKYHHALDMVVYRAESGPYVSEPVDEFLTLFLDAQNPERLVGVKLKGFRFYFLKYREKIGWTEEDFLPLMRVVETMLNDGLGYELVRREERRKKYELAVKCVAQITLTPAEAREIVCAA
jgi:hypothetical protein